MFFNGSRAPSEYADTIASIRHLRTIHTTLQAAEGTGTSILGKHATTRTRRTRTGVLAPERPRTCIGAPNGAGLQGRLYESTCAGMASMSRHTEKHVMMVIWPRWMAALLLELWRLAGTDLGQLQVRSPLVLEFEGIIIEWPLKDEMTVTS